MLFLNNELSSTNKYYLLFDWAWHLQNLVTLNQLKFNLIQLNHFFLSTLKNFYLLLGLENSKINFIRIIV